MARALRQQLEQPLAAELDFEVRLALLIDADFGRNPLYIASSAICWRSILDGRYDKAATLINSRLPKDLWHSYLDAPTLFDAILDRLIHNAHRIQLNGDSMRVRKAAAISAPAT